MPLINLTSDLSKINEKFKNPNRFDTNKDSILDDSYTGKALVGKDLNQTLEYQLKTKLNEQRAAPNNKSWSVPNIADKPNFTPTSNYIDSTKPFYGGNINPYSKGTPLDSITFTSKLNKVDTEYPAIKPYSFIAPTDFKANNDFSLPFETIYNAASRVGRYSKGTPLVPIGKTSQWNTFDYPTVIPTIPYSFDKPFGYPDVYKNDFSLPFDSYTKSRVTNYTKGTPLKSITFTSKLESRTDYTKYKTISQTQDSSVDTDKYIQKYGTLTQVWNLNKAMSKNDYHIDNDTTNTRFSINIPSLVNATTDIFYGTAYYDRIKDDKDSLGLYNASSNSAIVFRAGMTSLSQPSPTTIIGKASAFAKSALDKISALLFINTKGTTSFMEEVNQPWMYWMPPPAIGKDPVWINTLGKTASALNVVTSLFSLKITDDIINNRRSHTLINEKYLLGSRAAESLLSVRHFVTDTIRTQSYKTEAPVKLFNKGLEDATSFIRKKIGDLPLINKVAAKGSVEFHDSDNNPFETDQITLGFVYFDENLNFNKSIQFKSYLTQFNETISPEWSAGKYLGHPVNYATYKGISSRTASIVFSVYAKNLYERDKNWQKLNKLASLCYPQYSKDAPNRMQGPIIRLHLGSIYKGMPGYITNLNFELLSGTVWDTYGRELPHGISVNIGYNIIGHVLPEMDKLNNFDVFRYKRFDTSKGRYYLDPITTEDTENSTSLFAKLSNTIGTFDGKTDISFIDESGVRDILERLNRKKNDLESIISETASEKIPI